jgi:hypothetical protein
MSFMTRVQNHTRKPVATAFSIDRGPVAADTRLILAHGAGVGITSPFFETMGSLLADRGVSLTLFEFAYMAGRRHGGPKRPPPPAEALVDEYRATVAALRKEHPHETFVIGGKSLGGRVASLVADELHARREIAGLVCLGYPFHPPGKPDQLRTEHLEDLRCPTLVVQGDRDPFGKRTEVEKIALSHKIAFAWVSDGDHDFGPRGRSGFTRNGNLAAAADAVAAFVANLPRPR